MNFSQLRLMAIPVFLTAGLIGCGDPVSQSDSVSQGTSASPGESTSQSDPASPSDAVSQCDQLQEQVGLMSTDLSTLNSSTNPDPAPNAVLVTVVLEGNPNESDPSMETAIQDIASLSVSDAKAKELQTRYVAIAQEIHQAARDWLTDPSKQESARMVIEQKEPEAQELFGEIASTCLSLQIDATE